MILMAMSNKFGCMLLTTGNKSEMAVGYATLYGDMAGGFAPLKDCSKTLVYRLAAYRNARCRGHPAAGHRAAAVGGAAPDQKDTDSLPPYEVLDPILEAFHRGRRLGRPDRRARLRSRRRRAHPRHGQAQRVQAPPGAAGHAHQPPRFRARLALSDHLGVCGALGRSLN
jgi:NAD+ synthetase